MVRHLRETGRERVGMKRPHRGQGAQDDEVERPLQQLDMLVSTGHASGECQPLTRKSSGELRAANRSATLRVVLNWHPRKFNRRNEPSKIIVLKKFRCP